MKIDHVISVLELVKLLKHNNRDDDVIFLEVVDACEIMQ
jgi:hypothetical protein